jgi:hypothetical protein
MRKIVILVIALFLYALPSLAQVEDTTRREPPVMLDSIPPMEMPQDTIPPDSIVLDMADTLGIDFSAKPFLSSTGVQFDYGKLITSALPFESKFEAGLFARFKGRVQWSVDYGRAMILPNETPAGTEYLASGDYLKSGLAWLMYIDPVNKILIGGNYGRSTFRDRVSFFDDHPMMERYPLGLSREGLSADWAEFYIGSEGPFRENLFIGFRFHYRMLVNFDQVPAEDFRIRLVPGYGATQGNSVIGLNFYLRYVWGFAKD